MQPDDTSSLDNELYDEIDTHQNFAEQYFGLSWPKLSIAVVLIICLGIYLGVLLFGTNSLQVLLGLEEYETYLKEDIDRLKTENAVMQKEYFELRELDADSGTRAKP
jgi:hypothetical protein